MEWFLQWCRRRGCRECKRNPKRFDLLKIRAKSLKIWAKSLKIWAKSLKIQTKALYLLAKSLKIWAKMRPNVVWLRKMALKVCRKTSGDHFLEVTPQTPLEKVARLDNFLGRFGEIWAKILCTPKNVLAPAPVLRTCCLPCTAAQQAATSACAALGRTSRAHSVRNVTGRWEILVKIAESSRRQSASC